MCDKAKQSMDPSEILGTSKGISKSQKRRQKKLRARNRSRPPAHLGMVCQGTLRNKLKKIKITGHCLDSIVQDFCGSHISSFNVYPQGGIAKFERFQQPVKLSYNSVDHTPPDKPNEVITIDLSDDLHNQKEVIDLTESSIVPEDTPQPNVIDISDEKPREESKSECPHDDEPEEAIVGISNIDTDEISVIGTFTKISNLTKKPPPLIPLSDKWSNLITCSESLKRKYLKKHSVLDKIDNKPKKPKKKVMKNLQMMQRESNKIGENVYVNSLLPLPSNGLRPIIIDGNNVAYVRSNCHFNCKRLEICINYFKEKGHKVTAFVPQFRLSSSRNDNPELLRKLEKQGDVVLTPSKRIDGRTIVPYDDRFIVQTAVLKGGIIVTRDNYKDLLEENPAWAETIKYRTLAFTWVDDVLMFPKDPLGEFGPSLEQFLRFH